VTACRCTEKCHFFPCFKIPYDDWHWTQDRLNITVVYFGSSFFLSLLMIADILCFSFIWTFYVKSGDRGGQWSDLARTNRLLVCSDVLLVHCDGVDAVTRHIVCKCSVRSAQWLDSATATTDKIIICLVDAADRASLLKRKMFLTLLAAAIFNFRLIRWPYWLRVSLDVLQTNDWFLLP